MPNKLDVLLEAERRGRLPPQHQAVLNEARKRGLVGETAAYKQALGEEQQKTPQDLAPVVSVPHYYQEDGQERTWDKLKPETRAKMRVEQDDFDKAQKTEESRLENRGIGERAVDTAAFIPSMAVRTATRGEYGLGDVVGAVDKGTGESIAKSESDFATANQFFLEQVGKAGAVTPGIPMLRSMGAVPGYVAQATANAAKQLPSVVKRSPAPATQQATPLQRAQPAQAAQPPQNIQSLPDRLRDMQAFKEEGIQPFAPALASKGTARTARTIEELPVIGGVVKAPKDRVGQAVEGAVQNLGRSLGAPESEAAMGDIAQHGLHRFRAQGLEDLPENYVQQMGINPNRPVPTASGSGNVRIPQPDRLNTAGMSKAELDRLSEGRVELPGSNRTTVEDLSPAELSRIIKAPASATSAATKMQALYARAHSMLPPLMRSDGSRNPNQIATRHAAQAVNGILKHEGSAEIQAGVLEGRFGRLAPALANMRRNFTLDSLRAARTELGRALGEYGDYDARLSRSELKTLYGAVSRDMEAGYVALAARARQRSKLSPSAKDYVSPQVAERADKALKAFKQADRFTRLSMERMDRFMNVLGAKNLNQAARTVISRMKERTQDAGMMREMVRSLRPEEWNSIRGYIIQNLGRARAGSKEAESGFNFSHWATDWHQLVGTAAQPTAARSVLLHGLEPDIARRLDNIARIVDRMKYYETTKNYSGSAYTGATGLAIMSPSVMATAAAFFGGSALLGKLMTSRAYTAWLEGFMKAQMRVGNTAKANTQITAQQLRRLGALAARQTNPELAKGMQAVFLAIQQDQERREQKALPAPK